MITVVFLLPGCSASEGTTTPTNFEAFEFSGIFRGTLYSNGATSEIQGYVTIQSNGATTLDLLTGRMIGTSVHVGDQYNITIANTYGQYQYVTNITGTIEISSRSIFLSGTNADGTQVTLGGTVPPVTVQSTGGWENLNKSAVFFSHHESCKVSVAVNGVTFGGLNQFYQNESEGLCTSYYALSNLIYSNYDALTSKIFCSTITLMGLNGNPITYNDCSVVGYYLNKNSNYNYTATWENGQITTGTFTSPSGGAQLNICLSNNGPDCNHELNGKWLSSAGVGLTISGTQGVFYSFSTNWQTAANSGYISIGNAKLRNISVTSPNQWNCQDLWLKATNGNIDGVMWSTDGTITMSADGSTIAVTSTGPISGTSGTNTYTRVP